MYPSKDIIDNAVNSKDHTTLVAAVKAAGLVDTLKGKGPFTVFAPTDAAFAKLPAGTVDTLVKPENKATLTKILTYHVVAGKIGCEEPDRRRSRRTAARRPSRPSAAASSSRGSRTARSGSTTKRAAPRG